MQKSVKHRVNSIVEREKYWFFNQWYKRIRFFQCAKSFMNTGSARVFAKHHYGHFRFGHAPSPLIQPAYAVNLPRTVNKDCLAWQNSHTVISKNVALILYNAGFVIQYLCVNLYRVHISSQSEI